MEPQVKNARSKRRIERRPLASLTPHPSQGELFGDLSDAELQQLADDIRENSLINAVEILDDGTIIAGHQRVRAAKLLGWPEIECWVRDDLDEQGEAVVETRLIPDNLHRRHLSQLDKARCYVRLKEAERDSWEDAQGDLRDQLAKQFNVTGRTLDRLAKMLDAPIAVQHAFDRGELTQNQVLAIVRLDCDQQQQIAERIDAGELPKEVVKKYAPRLTTGPMNPNAAVLRLVHEIKKARKTLDGRMEQLDGRRLELQITELESGKAFLHCLRDQISENCQQYDSEMDDLIAELDEL